MQLQPKQKMVIRMTLYSTVLGGLAGALSAVTLLITSSNFQIMGTTIPSLVLEILLMGTFGLIFGGLFGVFAGLYSGVGMAVATSVFFQDILSKQSFKIVMGTVTAICTLLFFRSGLWQMRLDGISVTTWDLTLLMVTMLAVYASQRVTSIYLYEWSIRKQKVYA